MTKLTVKDLAQRVARPHEDVGAVIARLRNWTKEGLLTPAGEKNPGTGRARTYDQSAVLNALVLTALTDLGVPAVQSSKFKDANNSFFKLARQGLRMAAAHDAEGVAGRLSLICSPRLGDRSYVTGAGAELPEGWESGVVINLTALVRRARAVDPELKFELISEN